MNWIKSNIGKIAISIGVFLLASVFAIEFFMLNSIAPRLLFTIDGISFHNQPTLTLGENSDICFKGIPEDYMKISTDGNHFSWTIDSTGESPCRYYKINGANPNRHTLQDSDTIYLDFRDGNIHIAASELMDSLKQFEKQEYFFLRNLIARFWGQAYEGIKDDKNISSFIYKKAKANDFSLCILDTLTHLNKDVKYVFAGNTTDSIFAPSQECKIQFFTMQDFSTKALDNEFLSVSGINFFAKPTVLLTQWGAGHIMLRSKGNTVDMLFPKSLMFVEEYSKLTENVSDKSGLLTIKQSAGGYPIPGDIFVPMLSNAINSDLVNLKISEDSLILQEQLVNEKTDTPILIKGHFGMLPTQDRYLIESGNATINCRLTKLNQGYWYSYLCWPLLVWVLVSVCGWYFFKRRGEFDYTPQSDRLRWHFIAIETIALAYFIGKILIAAKLSYTYPYFEKISGITIVEISGMLLLIYQLSLIWNHDIIINRRTYFTEEAPPWYVISAYSSGLLLSLLLIFIFHKQDQGFIKGMLQAFPEGTWNNLDPRFWFQSDSPMNDTHRSICYMLCLTNLILPFLPISFYMIRKGILALKGIHWFDNISSLISHEWNCLTNRWDGIMTNVWYNTLLSISLPAILIIFYFIRSGNFQTALITLTVIPLLSYTLTNGNYLSKPISSRPWLNSLLRIICMFVTTLVAIVFAFFPDHGYLTNYIGFLIAIYAFYYLMFKGDDSSRGRYEEETEKRGWKWQLCMLASLFFLIWLSPNIIRPFFSPEEVNYERYAHRFYLFTDMDRYQETGYRYADSEVEFMRIMGYYMSLPEGDDPLSNDDHPLHPSVSSGQSPVVLNDLSVPCAFLAPYGSKAYYVYFTLLVVLTLIVIPYSLEGSTSQRRSFDRKTQWRLLALFMWVGSTIYLYASYIGFLPFTGRLNPGMGVDSVGEAFETSILLSYMIATTSYENDN